MRALAAVVVTFGVIAGTAFAGSTHVIQGDTNAGGIRIGSSTASDVKRLFGEPTSSRVLSLETCEQSWKDLGLVVRFFSFDGKPCARRVALIVTVTGRAAWQTGRGLRVGDSVTRLKGLYQRVRPRSKFAGDTGYWLVVREVCAEAGGGAYPGLLARIRNDRVSALVARVAVCDYDRG